jgi:hypothetical protein
MVANIGTSRSQAGWDTRVFSRPTPAAPGHVVSNATATFAPIVALGKRHREVEVPQGDLVGSQTQEVPPQKRARGSGTTKGILKAVRSAARAHHDLVARIPKTKIRTNPRRRDAELRGSRPRVRRAFASNPCRDQVYSAVGWWTLRMES